MYHSKYNTGDTNVTCVKNRADVIYNFQKCFFAMRLLPSFPWHFLEKELENDRSSEIILEILKRTCLHPLCRKYPPSVRYRRLFLSQLIKIHEASESHPLDELYDALGKVLCVEEGKECYKSYLLPGGEAVTLSESVSVISEGTTGLVTWEAGLYLAEWAVENPHLFSARTVLELGSGVGLAGITVCRCCSPSRYVFSDCHLSVLQRLRDNLLVNGLDNQCFPRVSDSDEGKMANQNRPRVSDSDEGEMANQNSPRVSDSDEGKMANQNSPRVSDSDMGKMANQNSPRVSDSDEGKMANQNLPRLSDSEEWEMANQNLPRVSDSDEGKMANQNLPRVSDSDEGKMANHNPPRVSDSDEGKMANHNPPRVSDSDEGKMANQNLPRVSDSGEGKMANHNPPRVSDSGEGKMANHNPPRVWVSVEDLDWELVTEEQLSVMGVNMVIAADLKVFSQWQAPRCLHLLQHTKPRHIQQLQTTSR
uniref:FAM86 N-terminal domain-containing protein n=1 Tax=Esox lucius TaxID=8010 RepID=A0A3P9A103_ESOLU